MVKEIHASDWQNVLKISNKTPVLVEVYSTTCIPCKMLGRTLEAMSEPNEFGYEYCKLNCEELSDVSELQTLGIMSVPTLVLVHFGNATVLPKAMKEEDILAAIQSALGRV